MMQLFREKFQSNQLQQKYNRKILKIICLTLTKLQLIFDNKF